MTEANLMQLAKTLLATLTAAAIWGAAPFVGAATAQTAMAQGASSVGGASAASTPWVKGYNSTVRLIAGAMPPSAGGSAKLVAGVEIRMPEGWKTYWRHPGDDGGLPPSFDWAGSKNLKSAMVRYPAPERMKSLNGASIGYAKAVIFPVEIEAEDAAKPVEIALAFEFGICREICVPAEAKLRLVVSPSLASMPPDLSLAMQRVPQPVASAGAVLKSAKAVLVGSAPAITFDIATGISGARTDLFAELPGGAYLPMPQKSGEAVHGVQRFRIDLKGVEEAAQLAGKSLVLTVTGTGAASEVTWLIQ